MAGPRALIIAVASFCKAYTLRLPWALQGVLQGSSAELRELAAEGLGELVEATDEATLKPFTVQIAGPLIRLIGDRFSWQVLIAGRLCGVPVVTVWAQG